ncbi:MAG: signal peptide peptidase SppA [Rhodospirillales bacterium]
MSLDADHIVDRRRLKRALTFWRLFAVLALISAVLAGIGRMDGLVAEDHVARLSVEGIIFNDLARNEALVEVSENDRAKALIVFVDSPGGTVVGGEALYFSLREVAEKKPVVAVMGGTATSAAYMLALGADYIVARMSSITGSIGVLMQTADITGLLDKLGVKPETVKSSPLKAQPNPLEPFSEEAREATREIVLDLYNVFVDMVTERRNLDREKVVKLADGRIFTGRQALENGLVDALGGEERAREWLSEAHKIADTLPLKDVEIKRKDQDWFERIQGAFGKTLLYERLKLDGLVSLWHPGL